jgi:hypothetical protein
VIAVGIGALSIFVRVGGVLIASAADEGAGSPTTSAGTSLTGPCDGDAGAHSGEGSPTTVTPPRIASASPSAVTGLPVSGKYLSDLSPVERDNHSGDNGGVYTDAATISGRKYGHAVTLSSFCTNRDGGDFWADYDLSRSWTRFTATVGIDDRSRASSSATYTVFADSTPVASGPLALVIHAMR